MSDESHVLLHDVDGRQRDPLWTEAKPAEAVCCFGQCSAGKTLIDNGKYYYSLQVAASTST